MFRKIGCSYELNEILTAKKLPNFLVTNTQRRFNTIVCSINKWKILSTCIQTDWYDQGMIESQIISSEKESPVCS